MKFISITVIFFGLICSVFAKTYYVGSGESYLNISSALSAMSGGDSLIVRSGTYKGSSNIIDDAPSGKENDYTYIIAENDNVYLDGEYKIEMLNLSGDSYVQVEGFTFLYSDDGCQPGSYTKIIRCGFGMGNSTLLSFGISNLYNLVEDCYFWGSFGHAIMFYGANHNVIRRVVVRWDLRHYSADYNAVFGIRCYSAYNGGDSRHAGDNLFQNIIFLDFNAPVQSFNPGSAIFRVRNGPMNTNNIKVYGGIILNCDAHDNWRGWVMANDAATNDDNDLIHSVAWQVGGPGIDLEASSTSNINIENCVFGNTKGHEAGNSADIFRNNIYYNNSSLDAGTYSYNVFFNTPTRGSNYETYNPLNNGLKYLVRIEGSSNLNTDGSDGKQIGADITKRYGVSGTLYGETGYNQLTNTKLWPWQNESRIKKDMSMSLNLPSNPDPSTYDPKRGFCEDGKTLTRYIWEYLGNTIPDDIYNSPKPEPPQNTRIGK